MAVWTVDKHVAEFGAELTDNSALTQFGVTEANIIEWLGEGFEALCDAGVLVDKHWLGVKQTDIDLVADQEEYDAPPLMDFVLYLWDPNLRREVVGVPYRRRARFGSGSSKNPSHYAHVRSKLVLMPTPSANVTAGLELYWVPQLGRLHSGTTPGNAASDTTLKLATTPTYGDLDLRADYYNELWVYMEDGGCAGDLRTISDYAKVGSDYVATVSSAFTATPQSGEGYSLVYPVPDRFQKLITYEAICAALVENKSDATRFEVKRGPMYRRFLSWLERNKTKGSGLPGLM